MAISKQKYDKALDNCQSGCKGKYCFYRRYLESLHPPIYIILQIKLIEKIKWIWSEENRREVTWEESSIRWVDDGYAKAYQLAFNHISDKEEDKIEDIEYLFEKTLDFRKNL